MMNPLKINLPKVNPKDPWISPLIVGIIVTIVGAIIKIITPVGLILVLSILIFLVIEIICIQVGNKNLSLVFGLIILVLFAVLAGAVLTDRVLVSDEQTATPTATSTPDNTQYITSSSNATPEASTKTQNNNVCYWDWKYTKTNGYDSAPGYEYIIVTIYLKNDADQSVSIRSEDWTLITDGIKYSPNEDITTQLYYDDVENNSMLFKIYPDVGTGKEIEVRMAYQIEGDLYKEKLVYNLPTPTLKRINHYKN